MKITLVDLYKKLSRLRKRKVRSQFFISLAFCIFGFGNILVGHVKKNEYLEIFNQSSVEFKNAEKKNSKAVLFDPVYGIDKQTQHLNKIKSRIDFYTITVIGGIFFLIISFTFFILIGINLYSSAADNIKSTDSL